MIRVVVLILTVTNTSNGDKLYESKTDFYSRFPYVDLIEKCRHVGVTQAKYLTKLWQATHPYATTNVDCHWESRPGEKA